MDPAARLVKSSALLALLFLANAGARAENAFPPDALVQKDIPYTAHGHPRQTFDLYRPAHSEGKPLPLILWLHGGGWKFGVKDWIDVKYLVGHGYALASIGYRFSADAVFPAQIRDGNAALDFLLKNSAAYGIDPHKVVVGGGSAGGHLALLLGLARDEKDFGANPSFRPKAILDFFGPTDLTTSTSGISDATKRREIDGFVGKLLGASATDRPDLAKAASPLTYLSSDAPPVLILHGDRDDTVPLSQSQSLHVTLDRVGVRNDLLLVSGAGHDGPLFSKPAVQTQILSFLDHALSPPPHP